VPAKEALAWLAKQGSQRTINEMARYGIEAKRAFGVPMGSLLKYSKWVGINQELSLALWKSGWYEARLLAAMIDDPKQVTRRQMDAWARDFDNWGVCDTVCWHLFDYTPCAWETLPRWSTSRHEFVKRAAFAMMAGQAGHDKAAPDAQFLALLPLIEQGARDERNFVKKAVSWALRRIGHRGAALHASAVALATRMAASDQPSSRWVGKDALRDLSRPMVRAKVARLLAKPARPSARRR